MYLKTVHASLFYYTTPFAQWISTPSETKYWFQMSSSWCIFNFRHVDELMLEKQRIKMCWMGPM